MGAVQEERDDWRKLLVGRKQDGRGGLQGSGWSSFFLPLNSFFFSCRIISRKDKIKEREGFGKISKQVRTTL
jgi:hypothetical protein